MQYKIIIKMTVSTLKTLYLTDSHSFVTLPNDR